MYTTKEAAKILGLSPVTMRIYANKGIIKAQKRGRDWFISQTEVTKFKLRERKKNGSRQKKNEAGRLILER